MPGLGETTRVRVSEILARSRADLLGSCPGAVDVMIERGSGKVWDGVNGGAYHHDMTDDPSIEFCDK